MAETFTFLPRRTFGIVFHAILICVILGGCGVLIWLAFRETGSALLVVYLLGAIFLFLLLPIVGYRGYALLQGIYSLKRDGLRIRWGLRAEDVPLSEVKWVRPASDLEIPIGLPAFAMPGALLGMSEHPDLGQVEFIASSSSNLVIVATMSKVFVVSPERKEEFVDRFTRALEMGTLTPMEAYSAVPAAFVRQIALDKYGKFLIPTGLVLALFLLMLVGLSIPLKTMVSIGFDANGNLLPAVASSRLLLLPVLGILLYIFGTVSGVYFFRRSESRPVALLVWSSNVFTLSLLITASIILLSFA
jgi:hypothetical protein